MPPLGEGNSTQINAHNMTITSSQPLPLLPAQRGQHLLRLLTGAVPIKHCVVTLCMSPRSATILSQLRYYSPLSVLRTLPTFQSRPIPCPSPHTTDYLRLPPLVLVHGRHPPPSFPDQKQNSSCSGLQSEAPTQSPSPETSQFRTVYQSRYQSQLPIRRRRCRRILHRNRNQCSPDRPSSPDPTCR